MATQPDQIREEIEATRGELAGDVDRLANRTSPKRIARRRWNGLKERVRGASDRVMGPSAQDVTQAAREAPAALARQAQGNPVAAGMIAFGAGLLAATLIPQTGVERRAGERIAEQADTIVEPLKDSGRELGENVRGSLRQATEQVKQTASEAASRTG
ncbi:MAG TPA: DUF3618 domain-containing protein [Micromonosporaceae bacterium]|jgi:hypothetical protein